MPTGLPVSQASGLYTVLAGTVLTDGATLIALASSSVPSGTTPVATVFAVSSSCSLDGSFGQHGIAKIALPGSPTFSELIDLVADPDGGFVLAGLDDSNGFVARYDRHGHPERSFGKDGVATLVTPQASPAGSGLDTIAVAPSGHIFVGADNGAGHCCVTDWAAELNPDGTLDNSFGEHGWVGNFDEPGSYVEQLLIQPDGSLLVDSESVHTGGVGGVTVSRITSKGTVDPKFATNFDHALLTVGEGDYDDRGGYYVAIMYQRPKDGFGLVGTGAQAAAGSAGQFEMAVAFNSDGTLDTTWGTHGQTRLNLGDDDALAVTGAPGQTIAYIDSPWAADRFSHGTFRVTAYTASGAPDSNYGPDGTALVTGIVPPDTTIYNAIAISTAKGIILAEPDDTNLAILELKQPGP